MNAIIKILDVVLIVLLLHLIIYYYGVSHTQFLPLGFLAAVFYLLLSEITNAHIAYYSASLFYEILITTILWIIVVVGALVFLFLLKESSSYSRFVVVVWSVSVPILLLLWHLIARELMGSLMGQSGKGRRAVVVGTGDLAAKVKNTLQRNAWLGFQYVGVYEDREANSRLRWEDDVRGRYKEMIDDARAGKFEVVFIALPLEAQVRIMTLVDQFGDTTVSVYMVPDFFLSDLVKGNWHNFAGMQVMSVFDTPFWGVSSWVKRVEDVVLGSLILLIILLPMLFIALAIKLTSPGPVIFKQRRYGMDGREISVLKFRSMRVMEDDTAVQQAQKNDSRLTSLGKFLRQTSLDELPQFLNVVIGTMSIVGPRPHAVSHNEDYRKDIRGYMLRHKIKPGITGWAQVNGWRGETNTLYKMQKRIDHDLWYLDNWSLWLDIKIIFMTIIVGFRGKNAY